MYAGHAAIATFVKGKRPRLSLALLVPVAFAPDWVELIGDALHHQDRMLSHSLVSVGIGATLTAAIFALVTREFGLAGWVWATYVSHWCADFITGRKPTWPGGPEVGLALYEHATYDVIVESIVVLLCWMVYRRSLTAENRRRRFVWVAPVVLILLQVIVEAADSIQL